MTHFTPRIHRAIDFASVLFLRHFRKDPDISIPVISHLVGVGYILAGHDFDEDTVVAGILHDFHEDIAQTPQGTDGKLIARVGKEFGPEVLRLVEFVSQKKYEGGKKREWGIRNEEYREWLCSPEAPDEARAISCADKIHNIGSLLMALDRNGRNIPLTWKRMGMKRTPGDQLRKFKELHHGFSERWQHPLLDKFEEMIKEFEKVVGLS